MGKIRRNIKARYKAVKEAVTKPCTRSTSTSMSTTSSRIPSPVPARRGPGRPRKHGLKPGRPLKKAKTTKNSHNVIYSKYVYICNCHCSKKNINYHCLCLDFKRTTISLKTQNSYRLAITGWREIQKMDSCASNFLWNKGLTFISTTKTFNLGVVAHNNSQIYMILQSGSNAQPTVEIFLSIL